MFFCCDEFHSVSSVEMVNTNPEVETTPSAQVLQPIYSDPRTTSTVRPAVGDFYLPYLRVRLLTAPGTFSGARVPVLGRFCPLDPGSATSQGSPKGDGPKGGRLALGCPRGTQLLCFLHFDVLWGGLFSNGEGLHVFILQTSAIYLNDIKAPHFFMFYCPWKGLCSPGGPLFRGRTQHRRLAVWPHRSPSLSGGHCFTAS